MSRSLFALAGGVALLASPLAAQSTRTTGAGASTPGQPLRFLTVRHTGDAGPGSLRWAIQQANARAGRDFIRFRIGGGGVHTIAPLSQLPPLTDPAGVVIDGFSQRGAAKGPNPPSTVKLAIELDGSLAGGAHGLWLQSDNNVVRGLAVNRFDWDGIRVEGGLANGTADFNRIECNFVGTDPTGTVGLGNGVDLASFRAGIHVCNVAGGQANDNDVVTNLSSANVGDGVWIEGPRQPGDVGSNDVTDNYVGTDASGSSGMGNTREGVALTEGTHHNEVRGNVCSDNGYDGIGMQGFNNAGFPDPPIQTHDNLIVQNIVGLDATASVAIPNVWHGVAIGTYGPGKWGCADDNTVSQNVIAFNGADGIGVWEDSIDTTNGDGNRITQNSIYDNTGLGIDLQDDGVTPNDVGDFDFGPNEEVNFPVISSASFAGSTTISGTVSIDTDPTKATVEVFKVRFDPSGNGEGEVYLGSATPNGAGSWSLVDMTLVPGDMVTATTTDIGRNTSEFAANVTVF